MSRSLDTFGRLHRVPAGLAQGAAAIRGAQPLGSSPPCPPSVGGYPVGANVFPPVWGGTVGHTPMRRTAVQYPQTLTAGSRRPVGVHGVSRDHAGPSSVSGDHSGTLYALNTSRERSDGMRRTGAPARPAECHRGWRMLPDGALPAARLSPAQVFSRGLTPCHAGLIIIVVTYHLALPSIPVRPGAGREVLHVLPEGGFDETERVHAD